MATKHFLNKTSGLDLSNFRSIFYKLEADAKSPSSLTNYLDGIAKKSQQGNNYKMHRNIY